MRVNSFSIRHRKRRFALRDFVHYRPYCSLLTVLLLIASCAQSSLAQIVVSNTTTSSEHRWVRPSTEGTKQPLWGHVDGIRIGLHPLGNLRGLLRVYAPYLGHDASRPINYIAVEPIVAGTSQRGYSELEHSRYDNERGKRFWSTDHPADKERMHPTQGVISREKHAEVLRVFVQVEPFDNGAHVYLRLTFRSDLPYEVGIASFAHDDSAKLSRCIITSTMGNYARLRRLHLADRTVNAKDLWPNFKGNDFSDHTRFRLKELKRNARGDAIAHASPDEQAPDKAAYSLQVKPHWRYEGRTATQGWRCEAPDPTLEAWLNGRSVYWNSTAPIPGGVSFENFELVVPFKQGQEFWFSVLPSEALSHLKTGAN